MSILCITSVCITTALRLHAPSLRGLKIWWGRFSVHNSLDKNEKDEKKVIETQSFRTRRHEGVFSPIIKFDTMAKDKKKSADAKKARKVSSGPDVVFSLPLHMCDANTPPPPAPRPRNQQSRPARARRRQRPRRPRSTAAMPRMSISTRSCRNTPASRSSSSRSPRPSPRRLQGHVPPRR